MSGPFKQTRAAFLLLMLWGCALTMLAGCPAADIAETPRCDEARRCVAGAAEVCGEDGQTYACGALARCEGVIVDPSGLACMSEPAPVCPELCPSVCPEGSVNVVDDNGCTTCACEPVACPDVQPPACGEGQRTVCAADDVCGTNCWCEDLECPDLLCNLFCSDGFKTGPDGCDVCECNDPGPVCGYERCEPNTRSECYGDRDGDGCEECACVPLECPDEMETVECPPGTGWECVEGESGQPRWSCEPQWCLFDQEEVPECGGPGEVIICQEDDEGCQKCWCDVINCPDVEPPVCGQGQRTECLPDDVCGTSCWCEDVMCPPLQEIECERGQVARSVDRNGCSFLRCEGVACPLIDTVACEDIFCPYGLERDGNGCSTCECAEPEPCPGEPECDLFCEYGQVQGVDGCLSCACNPPPLCEPLACDPFCVNGYKKDSTGCDTCECESAPCLDDEQCGFYEACVFDLADPVACCQPGMSCDAILPACVGECQAQTPCIPGQGCGMGQACDAVTRDDCCHPAALTCTDDKLICPLLCLDQTP